MNLNKYFDHTYLKAVGTEKEIDNLLEQAIKYDFKSVCVNPCYVKYCREKLQNTDVLVCTVIGFPLGANTKEVKAFEAKNAIENGAQEVDMVINVGQAKAHNWEYVYEDIKAVVDAANGTLVKVILETCYLTDEEVVEACKCAMKSKAQFVKTSTGFGTGGATVERVKLMKDTVKDLLEVKASGGVRTYDDCMKMIENGATRIGTSNSVDILLGKEIKNNSY